jgi:YD repeat-containing protein
MTHWKVVAICGGAFLVFAGPACAASTVAYTYDVFGQLVAASSTAGRTVSYSYDAAGNRASMSATGVSALNSPAPALQLAHATANPSATRSSKTRVTDLIQPSQPSTGVALLTGASVGDQRR